MTLLTQLNLNFVLIINVGVNLEKKEWLAQQPKKFRELIEEMYSGFPNIRTHEERIKKAIVTEEDISNLVKRGYFIEESYRHGDKEGKRYGLGPNALNLISSWRNEELAAKIVNLTYAVFLLGILTLGTGIVNAISSQNITLHALIILLLTNCAAIGLLFWIVFSLYRKRPK